MALPGLGGDDVPISEEQDEVVHELKGATEWRFEVAFTEVAEIKLLSGDAEIFGSELAPQHTYLFRGAKAAIYTDSGCRFSSKGLLSSEYVAEDTPMVQYVNLHFALQQLRDANSDGPRALIMGPPNSGKTSLAKLLAAYALRSSDTGVISVNLNPKDGMLAPAGTLTASAIESIVDPETISGWGSPPTNGPMPVPVKLPLVYYYGLEDPETDEASYKALTSRLALSVIGRLNEDQALRKSGIVVDSFGSLGTGKASSLAEHVVSEFGITAIVVIGNERLYGEMSRRFPNLQVVKVDKSGGVIERDGEYCVRSRKEDIHEYFYGDVRLSLHPHSSFIDWSDLAIFKVVDPTQVSSIDTAFLPGGGAVAAEGSRESLEPVTEMTPELQGSLLAVVSSDPSRSQKEIRHAAVLGFIHVSEVDDKRRRLKVLAPMSGRLPRRTLLWGSWPEQMEMDSTTIVR